MKTLFAWIRERRERRERAEYALRSYEINLADAHRWLGEFKDVCLLIDYLSARARYYTLEDRHRMSPDQRATLFLDIARLREEMRRMRAKETPR